MDTTLENLKDWKVKNAGKYGILEMGIFGSVARGEEKPGSDVDIVITMKEPDLYAMIGIQIELEEHLNMSVDVVSSGTRNPYLKKRIERDKVIV
ncbi:MAG: nucleotidyltransferase family protein [Thermodesulfobacteriota bacterium]